MTDQEVLDLFNTDKQKATVYLIDKYSPLVYTIVYSKLGRLCSKEDIEETTADIFIQLCRYADRIDLSKGTIKSYLSVTAKRIAQRKAMVLNNKSNNIPLDEISNVVSDNNQSFNKKEQRDIIIECIKMLGKPDSDIIVLKYFYGLKSKEIAKQLGLKTNTVDKKISRSLVKLRSMLEEELYE